MKMNKGYSLVEMLIVIFIFTILSVIITQSLAVSLRSSRKGENISSVKADIDNAVAIMEKNLRYAKLKCISSLPNTLVYEDQYGNTINFSCVNIDPNDHYIASNSARITSNKFYINNCAIFTCNPSSGTTPASVDINISARDKANAGAEGATVNIQTKILTRDY
jgi:prepilin-type N-terminal cleavage/methylation domain-containing protein